MQQPLADELRQYISRRAYELHELRSGRERDEVADWMQAEGEVLAALAGPEPACSSGAEGTVVVVEGFNVTPEAPTKRRKNAPSPSAPKR
jgi:hypothetical protein